MGFKPDSKKKGTWLVWYSKRHPVTGAPIQLRRTGLRSKAEARKAEAQLIIEVENKIRRKVMPSWAVWVQDYRKHLIERSLTVKTVENCWLCLRAHTFPEWSARLVDSITPQEIRELIQNKRKCSKCCGKTLLTSWATAPLLTRKASSNIFVGLLGTLWRRDISNTTPPLK